MLYISFASGVTFEQLVVLFGLSAAVIQAIWNQVSQVDEEGAS